jgi:hypothetical protein
MSPYEERILVNAASLRLSVESPPYPPIHVRHLISQETYTSRIQELDQVLSQVHIIKYTWALFALPVIWIAVLVFLGFQFFSGGPSCDMKSSSWFQCEQVNTARRFGILAAVGIGGMVFMSIMFCYASSKAITSVTNSVNNVLRKFNERDTSVKWAQRPATIWQPSYQTVEGCVTDSPYHHSHSGWSMRPFKTVEVLIYAADATPEQIPFYSFAPPPPGSQLYQQAQYAPPPTYSEQASLIVK